MVPHELVRRQLKLPESKDKRIVVFTGPSLRHDRFALLIAHRFPDSFHSWFRIRAVPKESDLLTSNISWNKLRRVVLRPWKILGTVRQRFKKKLLPVPSLSTEEHLLFSAEVERLRQKVGIKPTDIENPNAAEILDSMGEINPYFMLTLGGARYSQKLIATVKGIALNQHDGWCPEYRGSSTVDRALYHRDYRKLGSTVHVLTSGMDAGEIVYRSTACLTEDDNRHRIFLRTVALGTDLICDAVSSIMTEEKIDLYDQPSYEGRTFLHRENTDDIVHAIQSDIEHGVFSHGLRSLREV